MRKKQTVFRVGPSTRGDGGGHSEILRLKARSRKKKGAKSQRTGGPYILKKAIKIENVTRGGGGRDYGGAIYTIKRRDIRGQKAKKMVVLEPELRPKKNFLTPRKEGEVREKIGDRCQTGTYTAEGERRSQQKGF